MPKLSLICSFFALCVLTPLAGATSTPPSASLFKDQDRWVAIGDSITQGGTYHGFVTLFYLTRFPDRQIDVFSRGISGDSAIGALRRYDWDIAPADATVATIMMGMNDVSRGLYAAGEPSEETQQRRRTALENYRNNMRSLISKLQKDGVRVQLVTPSIYDETMQSERENLPGVNSLALAESAAFLRELAAGSNGEIGLIDLHQPMTELNARLQQTDPQFTIVGADRVHPQTPGHLVMAYFFLKDQQAPAEVSHISIQTKADATPLVSESRNIRISDITGNAVSSPLRFKALAAALPFPVRKNAEAALNYVPFTDELNRETLQVSGLPEGVYQLTIDDTTIGSWSAQEFAAGINLALLSTTPQAKQSENVAALLWKWHGLVNRFDRGIAQVEHWHLRDEPRPVAFENVKAKLEERLEKLQASEVSLDRYNAGIIRRYIENKPEEAKAREEMASLIPQMRAAAQPTERTYTISRIAEPGSR